MFNRRWLFTIVACIVLLPGVAVAQVIEQVNTNAGSTTAGTAAQKLLELGPEGQALAKRAGIWDVSFTSWDRPDAAPLTITGLVAERQMIGPLLQEILHPELGAPGLSFTRVDYLTFNRIVGRWDYVSMDTRVPNGLMPAWSLDHDPAERVVLHFQPFATAGSGPEVSGRMMRMHQIIIHEDDYHESKDQYFSPANGVGSKWLAKRYSYTRRASR